MRLFVKATPGAKEEHVEQSDESHVAIRVKEPPYQGRANAAIVRALAKHFHVAPFQVKILRGHMSRQKIVEIS